MINSLQLSLLCGQLNFNFTLEIAVLFLSEILLLFLIEYRALLCLPLPFCIGFSCLYSLRRYVAFLNEQAMT